MKDSEQIAKLVDAAQRIVIIQADNPDADSLGSALALESILGDMGKEPFLYCALDMPDYLKHMPGWDRVDKELPANFDLSIIVDTSTVTLLEKLETSAQRTWMPKHPCIVLDHHAEVPCDIPYATVVINDGGKASTGELIYSVAKRLEWKVSVNAMEYIMQSILADSQGLSNENTTAETYRVIADLVDAGVNRPKLEELRRALTRMPQKILRFKGTLIERTEFHNDGALALVTITQNEINEFSPLYNPNPLIQGEHMQTIGVMVSVSMKVYGNGRITGSIRCNQAAPIAKQLAASLGGEGHAYAAGFKTEGKSLGDVKAACISTARGLLANLTNGK